MFQQKTKNFGSSKQGYLLWIVTVMNGTNENLLNIFHLSFKFVIHHHDTLSPIGVNLFTFYLTPNICSSI